ncbi:hypothetical protein [Pelotomaculum isophthalicicum]
MSYYCSTATGVTIVLSAALFYPGILLLKPRFA